MAEQANATCPREAAKDEGVDFRGLAAGVSHWNATGPTDNGERAAPERRVCGRAIRRRPET